MNDDNYFSINRLLEFGLGMAVARQMADSMNESLRRTHMPGLQDAPLAGPARTYHLILDGKQAGPFSERELSRLISEGKVNKDSYVWYPGMPNWATVENVADVLRLVALAPPPFHPESRP